MKQLIFILFSCISISESLAQGSISITTKTKGTNQAIENAVVKIYNSAKVVKTISTNSTGVTVTAINNGTYSLKITAPKMKIISTENIEIQNNKISKVYYMENKIAKDVEKNISLKTVRRDNLDEVTIGGGRVENTVYIVDGELAKSKSTIEKKIKMETIKKRALEEEVISEYEGLAAPSDKGAIPASVPNLYSAGKLTTGEINDFTKWKLFDEVSRSELEVQLDTWQFFMTHRYCVQAVNKDNNPVLNAKVNLLHDGKIIWTALTDNTGKAELWNNIQSKENKNDCKIELIYEGNSYNIIKAKLFSEGVNFIKVKSDCNYSNDVDIAFVVDATGSMGDEIQYLQAEMSDVITRANSYNTKLNINTSAVFYKDIGDDYVSKKIDFSNTLSSTTNFINQQSAGGGGDFPEAVDEALKVAIQDLSWRENARTKIIFLVLDAPPHADEATKNRIYALTKECAAKGIRIIPLSGSGINKNTEYIMRSIALATNGTYTFLTNNSGIGSSHLAPSTDSFKVEKMNDLLIRLITQFAYIPECAAKIIDSFNNDNPFNEWDVTHKINIYPNPTTGIFYIDIPLGSSEILIADISGKVIYRIVCDPTSTKVQVDISNYARGIYFARVKVKDKWLNGKLRLE